MGAMCAERHKSPSRIHALAASGGRSALAASRGSWWIQCTFLHGYGRYCAERLTETNSEGGIVVANARTSAVWAFLLSRMECAHVPPSIFRAAEHKVLDAD